ncbi:hypothetical protein FOLKNPGA_03153 [Legionella sp. PC1000]|uniref:hypothetical protein n=1 Tax=Legionella sp. PC1000 TaxID=2746060 RepID=UPI0015FA557F|nr:hypothetical protein [Legionella sp. PC1000]QLZ70339.1 hypothetical protein FOLKNPGA_03153 [Legionella sp. PC1000]
MICNINFLRLYAIIFLIIYDRHYFFSLCYKKGAGVTTEFVPFYFNAECFYWALFAICATYLILFFATELGRYIASLILRKKQLGVVVHATIVLLTSYLLHHLKLFTLVT